jgi:hypothetical protein
MGNIQSGVEGWQPLRGHHVKLLTKEKFSISGPGYGLPPEEHHLFFFYNG